jgi:hypothetical protein
MKIISSKAHGILDYATAAFLLLAPTLFKMEGDLCTITYVLGAVHLTLTALTDFEVGLIKVIPFRIHGLIEVVVAVGLAALAFWFYNNENAFGFYFYMALAVIIMIVFILSDFKTAASKREPNFPAN